jgi:two-component system, chemotaxis family, chemotaxis protein CheY
MVAQAGTSVMSKKIALVGHCGPDSSYLRIAVARAIKDAKVIAADDDTELRRVIEDGADLLLLNRVLDYGFADHDGVGVIRKLREKHPQLKMMLVSNYAEAQAEAVEAGALPGFGKRELGTPRVNELLRDAVKD